MSSGWIKFEKDVRTDPRFLRMLKAFRANVTQVRINERSAVTLLVGCLVELWCYADTHIREDDTLDIGPDEVDELIGVEGFAALMPVDWLEVVDQHRIKLPGFQEHNGTTAKKRALTAKRVAAHRVRNVTQVRSKDYTGSNAGALPDQTRLDHTRPDSKNQNGAEPLALGEAKGSGKAESVDRVFEHWKQTHGHAKAQLDEKRRKLIARALEHYGEDDLLRCVSGYRNSPHHMGANEAHTTYDAIDLMLRDSKHIDAGLKFWEQPPQTNLSPGSRRAIDQTADWVPPEVRRAAG